MSNPGWPARAFGVAIALAALAGCGGDDGPDVSLDGSPRRPDDQGVLTAVSDKSITLDGKRTYEVDKRALAFSTYTRAVESLVNRKGQYVQVGLDGDRMEWMAGIAAVVRGSGQPPVVYYIGHLDRATKNELVFRDGTVLTPDKGLEVPVEKGQVQVKIDPAKRRVIEVLPQ